MILDHYIMTDIYEEDDDYFRNDKENKNSDIMLRSWVQLPPPGPLFLFW
jgi:ABC-type oligopeptide transport system substrate-binding subunit